MSPSDLGTLLFASMRYAYGRQTYIVSDVTRIVCKHYADCTVSEQLNLLRDLDTELRRAKERGELLGNETNHTAWMDLHRWMAAFVPDEAKVVRR